MNLDSDFFKFLSILTDAIAIFSAGSAIIYGIFKKNTTQGGIIIINIISISFKIIVNLILIFFLYLINDSIMIFINVLIKEIISKDILILSFPLHILVYNIISILLFTVITFLISSILWTRSLNTIKIFYNFLVPSDWHANLIHVKLLTIISAKYGAENSYIDVTTILKRMIVSNKLKIIATNDIAGDPIFGIPKILKISYMYDGESLKELEVNEGDLLIIKPIKS